MEHRRHRYRFSLVFSMASVACLAVLCSTEPTRATVVSYVDQKTFETATGPSFLLDFADLEDGAPVSSQYAASGILFSDGNDTALTDSAFLTDQRGLWGHGSVSLQFSSPLRALGVEFAGALQIDLFNGSLLVGTSQPFAGFGDGLFAGLTSSEPFDRAVLIDWYDGKVFIDNLRVANTPAPVPVPDLSSGWILLLVSFSVLVFLRRGCLLGCRG